MTKLFTYISSVIKKIKNMSYVENVSRMFRSVCQFSDMELRLIFSSIFKVPVITSAILIILIALLGDYLSSLAQVKSHIYIRACTDSLTHGLIGLLSWIMFSLLTRQNSECVKIRDIILALICMFFAMSIDVDHFLEARSLTLKDALSLKSRPFLHNTTLILTLILLIFLACYFGQRICNGQTLTFLVALAWLPHHFRDGLRRGLWMPPFGNSPPIPYLTFFMLTLGFPILMALVRCLLQKASLESDIRSESCV